ncbi:MAG: YaeQ family protein [Bdellovibrionota bacterium]
MSTRQLYTFDLVVNDTTQECYSESRVQLSIHPEETPELSYARVLAYAHCLKYSPTLSDDSLEAKNPTLYSRDVSGEYLLWGHVGEVHKKTLKVILRLNSSLVRFYFFAPTQIATFCHLMRGSKQDWVSQYEFFLFDEHQLTQLATCGFERRNTLEIAFLEDILYLTKDGETLEGPIKQLDMWEQFQESLKHGIAEGTTTEPLNSEPLNTEPLNRDYLVEHR